MNTPSIPNLLISKQSQTDKPFHIRRSISTLMVISSLSLWFWAQPIHAAENSMESVHEESLGLPQKSILDFPITGTDPLFENLLIEFAKYSTNREPIFQWFFAIAEQKRSLDYAMLAFREASMLEDETALKKSGDLWLKLSENESDKLKFFYVSIIVSMNQGDTEKAKEFVSQIMESSNDKPQILNELLVGFDRVFKQNNNADFLELIDYAINYLEDKDKVEAYFQSSKIAFSWNDINRALEFSSKALKLEPNRIDLKLQRLGIFASTQRYEQLVQFLNLAIKPEEYSNLNLQVINIYLITSLNLKNYGQHFEPLVQYLMENKQDTVIDRYVYGLYLIETNNIVKAKEMLESVVKEKSQVDQSALFNLASVYGLLGDFDNAVSYYEKVTDEQYLENAHFFASLIAATHLDDSQALMDLKTLQAQDPKKFVTSVSRLAEAYQNHKQLYLVRDYLDFILTHFPEDKIQLEIGLTQSSILYSLEDFEGFEALVLGLLSQYPDDAQLLNAAGYYLLDQKKDLIQAEPFIQKAYKLKPEDSAIIDSLGWLYFKKQDYQTALSLISKAYSIHPHPEILAHLIEVLFYLKQEKQAEDLLIQALIRIPQDNYLMAVRDRLFPNLKTIQP